MSNETIKTAVPLLRFPEFWEVGEWVEKELGKLGKFTGGGTPSKGNENFWQGNIPWVSSSDISEDSIHQVRITRFITNEALKESATKLVPENSILLVSRVGVGKLAIANQAVCTSQDFTNFTPSKDDLFFLAYYLKTRSRALLAYSQGMAIKGFTKEDVSTLEVFLPPLPEQQKIAACLSSLDDLLTAQTAKLAALQAHKRGLLQGLFPAAGETVPKLRFPEFREAGEWVEKSVGDALTFQTGFPFNSSGFNEDGNGMRLIRNRDLKSDNKIIYYSKPFDTKFIVYNGDILVGMDGDFTPFVWDKGRALLNQRVGRILTNASNSQSFFLYLLTIQLKAVEEATARTTVKHLSHSDVEKINTLIPSLPEQKKIAACLSSLDDRISAQTAQLAALQLHKKGLMQGLFPTTPETTA